MSPGRATQARDTGARLTQEATISPISKPAPAQIAGRLLYHCRNFTPVTGKDETEQELECDFSWSAQHAKKLLEEITDVNEGEKTLMKMWNEHVIKYDGQQVQEEALLGPYYRSCCSIPLPRVDTQWDIAQQGSHE